MGTGDGVSVEVGKYPNLYKVVEVDVGGRSGFYKIQVGVNKRYLIYVTILAK